MQKRALATNHNFGELHAGSDDENKTDGFQVFEIQRYKDVLVEQTRPWPMTRSIQMPWPSTFRSAASRFLDTPMNGHSPRNRTNTKLLTRTVPTRMRIRSVIEASIVEGVAAQDTLPWTADLCLFDTHPRGGAGVSREEEYVFPAGPGRKHHALRHAKTHLSRFQVCDGNDKSSLQIGRIVGGLDTGEDDPRFPASIERQFQQLVSTRNGFRLYDLCDAKVDFREILNRYLVRIPGILNLDLARQRFPSIVRLSSRPVPARPSSGAV